MRGSAGLPTSGSHAPAGMLFDTNVHTGYADRWRHPGLPTPDLATCQQHGLLPWALRPHAHKHWGSVNWGTSGTHRPGTAACMAPHYRVQKGKTHLDSQHQTRGHQTGLKGFADRQHVQAKRHPCTGLPASNRSMHACDTACSPHLFRIGSLWPPGMSPRVGLPPVACTAAVLD